MIAIVFSDSLIASLRTLLDWVDALPAGRQGVVITVIGSGVLAFVGAIWACLLWFLRRLHRWRVDRLALRQIQDDARRVRRKTGVGLFGHAIQAQEAFTRVPKSIDEVGELTASINQKLIHHADAIGNEHDIRRKQNLIDALSRDLKREVSALSQVGQKFSTEGRQIVTGYHVLLEKAQLRNGSDQFALLDERQKFAVLGRTMPLAITALERRREVMAGLTDVAPKIGKQYEEAVTNIIEVFVSLRDFSGQEVPRIVNSRVAWWRRLYYAILTRLRG